MRQVATVEESSEDAPRGNDSERERGMVARVGVRLARSTPKWLLHAVCDWVQEGVLALIQARDPAGASNRAGYVYKVAYRARERDLQAWQAMAHGVGDTFAAAAAPPSNADAGWADRLRSLGVPMPAMRGRIVDLIAGGVRSTAAIAEILGRHHKTIQEHRHALCACLVRFARQQGLELPPELLAEVGQGSDVAARRKNRRAPRAPTHSIEEAVPAHSNLATPHT